MSASDSDVAQPTPGGRAPTPFPLRLDERAIRALRRALEEAGFTEQAVCERNDAASIYDFRTSRERHEESDPPSDALGTLIRLFMDGEPVDRSLAERWLGDGVRAATELGLARAHPSRPELLVATTLLYPTQGLYIASDLEHDPAADGDDAFALPVDAVYPAIAKSTQVFLSLLPDPACDRFLDLCTGTGIAALCAAPSANEAIAADVTERSVAFARFNAALNGTDNVQVFRGDLYDAVTGTFDHIVAHPPYMPALEQKLVYRDGGEDGEQVTRRVIEGLPRHLRPGGRLDCTCIMTDRRQAPIEKRVRAMLGDAHTEFDVLVVVSQINTPVEAYARLVREGRVGFGEGAAYVRRFDALDIEQLVGCALIITRHTAERPPVTVRRGRSPATDAAAIEWMLRWMEASTDAALPAKLLDAKPELSTRARLELGYAAGDGGWQPGDYRLHVDAPFAMSIDLTGETAAFLARCNGAITVAEHVEQMKQAGIVPADMEPVAFAGFVRSLAVGGFLSVAPPQPPMSTVG